MLRGQLFGGDLGQKTVFNQLSMIQKTRRADW